MEDEGRGYGREDFEVAHDLERCIVKWSGILKSNIYIGKFSIIIKQMRRQEACSWWRFKVW